MLVLIFFVGALLGVLMGGACAFATSATVAADITPRLQHVQLQLDNLETAINLALVTRYAEISGHLPITPPPGTSLTSPGGSNARIFVSPGGVKTSVDDVRSG